MKLNTLLIIAIHIFLVISIVGIIALIGYYIPKLWLYLAEKYNISNTITKILKIAIIIIAVLSLYGIIAIIGYYIPKKYKNFKQRYVSASEFIDSDKRIDDTYEYVVR